MGDLIFRQPSPGDWGEQMDEPKETNKRDCRGNGVEGSYRDRLEVFLEALLPVVSAFSRFFFKVPGRAAAGQLESFLVGTIRSARIIN
jgi:hypothetical protein